MNKILQKVNIPDNVWIWVTIESNKYLYRLDYLKVVDCKIKFLSLEPLLTNMYDIDLSWINWVIVWWESWWWARPINEEWVIDIKNKCVNLSIPFFFKQWGGTNKKKAWKFLQGKIYNEFPMKRLWIEILTI
jgi:protein gp37